ncbi:hypothetical protein BDY24DRAFT_94451 [Mrakia frigida]|uniref:uncharacterized protein n=1 Tax=Mrakia frigida TaxID=29902 RepID=UPI003FCC0CBF
MQIELSNQGRVEVDEESKDELLPSTSHISRNVFQPPPPSSSSSTTHPSTHPQLLSQLALEPAVFSNESPVSSQIAQLFSLVGQLKEENKAQASSVEELSRTVARLSSENDSLKRHNEDQHKLNGDLARSSIPGGFWVWEGSEGGLEGRGGRWVWSSEKYKVLPPPSVASGPPTSLLSLPVELLSLILDLLETKEHLVLSLVSFNLLELSSRCFYGDNFFLDPVQACDFVESRVFQSSPKSERITPLLLPSTKVHLYGSSTDAAFQDLVELASALPSPPSSLRVEIVSLEISDINELTPWTGLIRFVNPTEFHLWIGDDDNLSIPPTVRFVPLDFVASFTSLWTRLMCFYSLGHDSVLLLEGTESTSAFEECLRRCYPSLVLCGDLWRWMLDGTHRRERVPLEEIASFLARPFASYGEEELVGFYLVMKKRRQKARVGGEGVGSAEGAVVQ